MAPWAVSNDPGDVDVEDARMAIEALMMPGTNRVNTHSGFRPGPGGANAGLVVANAPANGYVGVSAFQRFQQTGRSSSGGAYIQTAIGTTQVQILDIPADPSNPRNDLIVLQQNDRFYGDGDNLTRIRRVAGTPAPSPADPAVTGSTDYLILARVRVRAGAASILSTDITDLRPAGLYTVGLGGVLPVASKAARDTYAAYDGMTVWRGDRSWLEVYSESSPTGWMVQGTAVLANTADVATAGITPYNGQLVLFTSDFTLRRYDSGAAQWRRVGVQQIFAHRNAAAVTYADATAPTGTEVDVYTAPSIAVQPSWLYRVVARQSIVSLAGNSQEAELLVKDGATYVGRSETVPILVSAHWGRGVVDAIYATGGAQTTLALKMRIAWLSGPGLSSVSARSDSTRPQMLEVYDLGRPASVLV
ncbi:MAG: hypothetical protein EPO06_12020 [Burkholderiaceae bacterium]|nr:MAG: hypothetical protein EPO06_12020 [Burkholderiaceae bacterium]